MKNISDILRETGPKTLILLDEIGSGTEPNEGAVLGIAAMESMYQKGGTIIATTHYGEIKDFALAHEDFQTAAMAFDSATLTPKYQLLLNQVGESNAFWIAEKMKIDANILKQAKKYLQDKKYSTEKIIRKKEAVIKQEQAPQKNFQQGDRVWLNEQKVNGIFYQYQDDFYAEVLVEKEMVLVPLKRLSLEISATQLYPADYDFEQLFTDYHERKFIRDIDRGSKKAQKKLRKLAEERQKH